MINGDRRSGDRHRETCTGPVWLTNWDEALAEARAARKVVLIDIVKDP